VPTLLGDSEMKINGKTIEGPIPEVIVIPKGDTEFIFKAMPILSYDEFEKMCPSPNPPEIMKPGGEKSLDYKDKEYNDLIDAWASKKNAWTVITSLKATEGLAWDTVVDGEPDTWINYKTELMKIFADQEIVLIIDTVYIANGLNQRKIDEATKRFLATPVVIPEE